MLGVGCPAKAQVNSDWVRGPNTVSYPPWGSSFLPTIDLILIENPPLGGIWIWIGLIFVLFRRMLGIRRWDCLIARNRALINVAWAWNTSREWAGGENELHYFFPCKFIVLFTFEGYFLFLFFPCMLLEILLLGNIARLALQLRWQ